MRAVSNHERSLAGGRSHPPKTRARRELSAIERYMIILLLDTRRPLFSILPIRVYGI
jgi:hypothetical protein